MCREYWQIKLLLRTNVSDGVPQLDLFKRCDVSEFAHTDCIIARISVKVAQGCRFDYQPWQPHSIGCGMQECSCAMLWVPSEEPWGIGINHVELSTGAFLVNHRAVTRIVSPIIQPGSCSYVHRKVLFLLSSIVTSR